jgi:hypothetical protein
VGQDSELVRDGHSHPDFPQIDGGHPHTWDKAVARPGEDLRPGPLFMAVSPSVLGSAPRSLPWNVKRVDPDGPPDHKRSTLS